MLTQFKPDCKEIIDFQGNDYCSTVRYVVYNANNGLNPVGTRLRINAGSVVDHAKYGSSSAIIDDKKGILITDAFFESGKTIEKLPISKQKVKGFKLPNWDKVLVEVEKTCFEYKELPLIAFDIAITHDGCKILEINSGCGTLISQFDKTWLDHQFIKDFYPNFNYRK